jgi:hypothetical protein
MNELFLATSLDSGGFFFLVEIPFRQQFCIHFILCYLYRMSVVEKEDWKSVIGLVTNAKQVISSVQDVAHKLVDYARFGSKKNSSGNS